MARLVREGWGGHPRGADRAHANNRLGVLAMRAAQCWRLGSGTPTHGLKECDYRITDDVTDPDPSTGRTRQTYVERLERLEGASCAYPVPHAPEVAALPSILGTFTFGTFNALAKVRGGRQGVV